MSVGIRVWQLMRQRHRTVNHANIPSSSVGSHSLQNGRFCLLVHSYDLPESLSKNPETPVSPSKKLSSKQVKEPSSDTCRYSVATGPQQMAPKYCVTMRAHKLCPKKAPALKAIFLEVSLHG